MTSSPADKNLTDTDLLAELVGKRHGCLRQLRDVGRRQVEVVAAGDMELLLKILAAKQRLLDALLVVEKGLAPFHEQDPESRAWRSPEARQRCAATAAECDRLLTEIIGQEKQSESDLIRRRDEAAARLQDCQAAAAATGAYARQTPRSPSQFNLSSE